MINVTLFIEETVTMQSDQINHLSLSIITSSFLESSKQPMTSNHPFPSKLEVANLKDPLAIGLNRWVGFFYHTPILKYGRLYVSTPVLFQLAVWGRYRFR